MRLLLNARKKPRDLMISIQTLLDLCYSLSQQELISYIRQTHVPRVFSKSITYPLLQPLKILMGEPLIFDDHLVTVLENIYGGI